MTMLPLSELLEDNTVGETLSADTDTLKHTITPQLVQDKVGVQFTSLGVVEKKEVLSKETGH